MNTIDSIFTPYGCSFMLKYNSNKYAYYSHMETQNHTSCKRNYTLLFFLHLRGTNHIAGSRLSIGKAGGYSKEQDKQKNQKKLGRVA